MSAQPPPPPPPPPGGYTPQAYAPQPVYGGFWIRFVAVFIDGIIVAIPIIILAVIVGVAAGASNANQQSTTAATAGGNGIVNLISFLITAGYFIYFWSRGSTLGQRIFRLRVVDANTYQPIGAGRAALRYVGYLISAFVCYIGLIWAAFDGRKQGWHDKIATTVVLQG